jgi:hypothetical protein
MFKQFAIFCCLLLLAGCPGKNAPISPTVTHIQGTQAERVAQVTAIIASHHAPPTALIDAQLITEQYGDGKIGPSDTREFWALTVAPEDLEAWVQLISGDPAPSYSQTYAAPIGPCAWWIDADTHSAFELYDPEVLTGRLYGWIGVSEKTATIYIYTFTM